MTKKSKAKAKQDDKQWEEWKKKDEEYVDENFEQDLQCALFQSKLDFETQKNSVSVVITTQDKNKKRKSKTMSLDQFLENAKPDTSKLQDKIMIGMLYVFIILAYHFFHFIYSELLAGTNSTLFRKSA